MQRNAFILLNVHRGVPTSKFQARIDVASATRYYKRCPIYLIINAWGNFITPIVLHHGSAGALKGSIDMASVN